MEARIKREVQKSEIPIIGKIKVGIKDENGLPRSIDYFVPSGNYSAKFNQVFGDKPNQIKVVFLSDDIGEVCFERYEIRTTKTFDGIGGRLFAKSDGENFSVWSKDKYEIFTLKDYPNLKDQIQKKCGGIWYSILTLRFILPDMKGIFGAWQLDTRGENSSIPQIISSFDAVRESAGTVKMIPFDLSVSKVKTQKPGDKSTFPVIQLIPNLSQESLERVREALSGGMEIRKLLTEEAVCQITK